jgi:hypothetical protein
MRFDKQKNVSEVDIEMSSRRLSCGASPRDLCAHAKAGRECHCSGALAFVAPKQLCVGSEAPVSRSASDAAIRGDLNQGAGWTRERRKGVPWT